MLFPVIEIEPEIQVGDKTRLSAVKSFVSKGEVALTSVKIQPTSEDIQYDVFSANQDDWYLDWAYFLWKADTNIDNNKLDFYETSAQTAIIPYGSYDLASLKIALKAALELAGAGTYTITSDDKNRLKIVSTVPFKITGGSASAWLGFPSETAMTTEVTGLPIEWLPRVVSLEIDNGTTPQTVYKQIKLYSKDGDRLFSEDGELSRYESDILKYVEEGRSSFIDVHRKAQTLILNWLDKNGYVNIYEKKFTKWDILDFSEVRDWSTFMVLKMIMENVSNATDDIFSRKRQYYSGLEKDARQRLVLRIDSNADGRLDDGEALTISTGELYRQ